MLPAPPEAESAVADLSSGRLHAPLLRRTTTVVRKGRHVLDTLDVHPSRSESGNRALPTTSWPADLHFKIFHTELRSLFSSLLGCQLASEGGSFPASLETTGAAACPAERITAAIGNRYRGVVETC